MKDSSATNTEQKERKLQSRTVRSISDLTMEDAANATEKALLLKYQTTLSQLEQQKEKLKNAKALYQNMIGDTDPLSSGVRKNLQDMLNMSNQVTVLENELKDIQNSYICMGDYNIKDYRMGKWFPEIEKETLIPQNRALSEASNS